MEYHQWRIESEISEEPAWTPKEKMTCGICKKLKELKSENYPKRIISSALEWWWGGMADDKCLSKETNQL